MVKGIKRFDRIEAPLEELHWLPIKFRINFKLLLLGYKCLHGHGPQYLAELLTPYVPTRSLCSSNMNCLVEPRTSMKTYCDRAFSVQVPKLWNNPPASVKAAPSVSAFKTGHKTHYFRIAFKK